MTVKAKWDVIIVGAGPVGSLVAGAVARHGASVLVLEREANIVEQTRASTLNSRTMEILSAMGVPGLEDRPRSMTGHYAGLPVDLSDVDSPWAGLWKMPQPDLVRLLRDWAVANGAAITTGVTFTQAQAVPSAMLSYCAAGDAFESTYLVGADGADSTVAANLNFTQLSVPATRHMIRCDITGVSLTPRRFEWHGNRVATAAEISRGIRRLMLFDPRYRATDEILFEDVCRDWLDATGERIDGGECIWLDQFSNGCSTAAEWVTGNVFLAGDAAHDQPPVGGSSLNSGIQDAFNLAWKLTALLDGAPPELAATYGHERAEATAKIQESVREQEALIFDADQSVRQRGNAVRDRLARSPSFRRHIARSVSGLDTHYMGSTQTGPRVSANQLGKALGRVLLGTEEAALGRRGIVVTRGRHPGDVLLIVRPDGHIAWVPGHPDAEPDSIMKRWFGDFLKPVVMTAQ